MKTKLLNPEDQIHRLILKRSSGETVAALWIHGLCFFSRARSRETYTTVEVMSQEWKPAQVGRRSNIGANPFSITEGANSETLKEKVGDALERQRTWDVARIAA